MINTRRLYCITRFLLNSVAYLTMKELQSHGKLETRTQQLIYECL
jgi:hypothetical protein